MADWQPIETAPKDGTLLLLFGPLHGPKYDRQNQRWTRGQVTPPTVGQGYFDHDIWQTGNFTIWHEPTHWMPLPAPPEQSQ